MSQIDCGVNVGMAVGYFQDKLEAKTEGGYVEVGTKVDDDEE